MKTTKLILTTAIIAGSAVYAAQTALAQPSGISITNLVASAPNLLWDVSLIPQLQDIQMDIQKLSHGQVADEVSVSFADPFTQDGRGKLTGSGDNQEVTVIGQGNGTTTFTGSYATKGSLSSSKGVARLLFTAKVSGTDIIGDARHPEAPRKVGASATYLVVLDANAGQLSGRSVERAAAAGLGSISESKPIDTQAIPQELGDGSWTLVLSFGPAAGNKLTGTATVSMQRGQVYPFAFTGAFSSRTGSKLNLKGQGTGSGSVLQVTLDANNAVTRIVGRVSGQAVNLTQ